MFILQDVDDRRGSPRWVVDVLERRQAHELLEEFPEVEIGRNRSGHAL